jgi:hypothetical protein
MAKGYMKYGYSRGPAKPGKPKEKKGDPFGPIIAKSKGPRKPKGFVATPKKQAGEPKKPVSVQYGQAGSQMGSQMSVARPSVPQITQRKEVGIRKPMETMYRGPQTGGMIYKPKPIVKQGIDDGYYIDGFRKRGGWINRLLNMMTGGR